MSTLPVPLLAGFGEIAPRYDVVLCDVWGVVHNGVAAFPKACEALSRYRAGGGKVALLTNAPRPNAIIQRQLDSLGVPRETWDIVVTSGDVTLDLIASHGDAPLLHIGPTRDHALFEGLPQRRVPVGEAAYVVCTGLENDEVETVADYADRLAAARARDLPMICANPDLLIHRGGKEALCAGSLAVAYEAMGGEVAYAGKPHPPIYELALRRVAALMPAPLDRRRVLAIGDSLRTDIRGAKSVDLDALMILDGIHIDATRALEDAALGRWLAACEPRPDAALRVLAW